MTPRGEYQFVVFKAVAADVHVRAHHPHVSSRRAFERHALSERLAIRHRQRLFAFLRRVSARRRTQRRRARERRRRPRDVFEIPLLINQRHLARFPQIQRRLHPSESTTDDHHAFLRLARRQRARRRARRDEPERRERGEKNLRRISRRHRRHVRASARELAQNDGLQVYAVARREIARARACAR